MGFMGVYKASLLEAIAAFGSISAAARVMEAEPRYLRELARGINEDFGGIIVVKRGRSGGAVVTAEGLALLQQFRTIEDGVRHVFAEDLREIEELIGSDPQEPRHWFYYDRWRQLSFPKIENSKRRPCATKSTIINPTLPLVHVYLGLFSEKLWIGEGYVILLRAIAKYGSIAAAARAMGWQYYNAKYKVAQLNRNPGEIVLTQCGRDGGATLTPRGSELADRFCRIQRGIYEKLAGELALAAHLASGEKKGRKIYSGYAHLMKLRAELL